MDLEQGVAGGRTRATWVQVLLVIGILMDVAGLLSSLAQNALLSRATAEGISEAEGTANDLRHGAIGCVQSIVFLATAVAWLVWLHRAYGNLGRMGTRRSDHTPGWAVGWWFIPFMNLIRPYQVTRELWIRSARRNDMESVEARGAPAVVTAWWCVYLLSGVAGQIIFRLTMKAESIEEIRTATSLGMVGDVLGVISAVLGLLVVRRIDLLQREVVASIPPPPAPAAAN